MPDLGSLISELVAKAQPRDDISPGSRPATFMGRVVDTNATQDPMEILRGVVGRPAIAEAEAGGMAMGAVPSKLLAAGMAKQFLPTTVNSVESLFQRLIKEGQGLNRQSLRPAVETQSGRFVGGLGAGHGNVYEAISPQQMKNITEGYVPAHYPEVFLNRDQGTIASGSVEGIKAALEKMLFEKK